MYIDNLVSINNPGFENRLGQLYPVELGVKDTTDSITSGSYLDLLLSIGREGHFALPFFDNLHNFNFYIRNFPFLSSKIPSAPAYDVFISQLI